MGKTFEKHNSHQIYIRENYKEIWKKFLELIVKDEAFKKARKKNRSGLISIAIMKLIHRYVQENVPSENNNSEEEDVQ